MMEITQIFTLFLMITGPFGLALSSPTENPQSKNDEPIPAATDPYIAHLVEMMNAPEPWDHL
jgi:hypothetical protein